MKHGAGRWRAVALGFKFQVWLVQAQSIGSRAAAGKTENCAGQGSRAIASYTS